jgi:AhpD family alkylhydroperoxidase
LQVWALSPEIGDAMLGWAKAVYECSRLDVALREVVRARIAQLNNCTVCMESRVAEMDAAGLTEEQYRYPDEWRSRPDLYDERQRLALEYTERFARDPRLLDDEIWDLMHATFDDGEILDLTASIGYFIGSGRILGALEIHAACPVVLRH